MTVEKRIAAIEAELLALKAVRAKWWQFNLEKEITLAANATETVKVYAYAKTQAVADISIGGLEYFTVQSISQITRGKTTEFLVTIKNPSANTRTETVGFSVYALSGSFASFELVGEDDD